MTHRTFATIAPLALILAACGSNDPADDAGASAATSGSASASEATGSTSESSTTGEAAGPTYYQDVAPVLSEHCGGCHQAGGVAPFALTTYEESAPFAALIKIVIEDGEMPPWPPGGSTPPLLHDRTLAAEDIALLGAWADAGAPAGDASTPSPLVEPEVAVLPSVDLALDIGTDYVPDDSLTDDYRCFMIDLKTTEDRIATGYRFIPGNGKTVHHILSTLFTADSRAGIEAADNETPEIGWPCFGGYSNIPDTTAAGALGGWVPGVTAVNYAAGTGTDVPAGALLVLQIHYNVAGGLDPDRTQLEVAFAPPAEAASLELLRSSPYPWPLFKIPANEKDVIVERELPIKFSAQDYPDGEAHIIGVAGHMHLLGTAFGLTLIGSGGAERPILEIPRWDFHWQGSYNLVTPLTVKDGDRVRIRCVYDNTAEHRASEGMGPPVDVTWGEGTTDEMCLAYLQMIDNLP